MDSWRIVIRSLFVEFSSLSSRIRSIWFVYIFVFRVGNDVFGFGSVNFHLVYCTWNRLAHF